MKVLGALLDLIGGLLPIIMKLADVFATALAPVITAFAGVIKSLMPFLTTIGNIFAALAQAVLGDLVSAFTALASLLIAIAPAFNILAKALESVFNVLENSGVFAALGDALEAIVPALAKLINLIVAQLAPFLPVVIGLVSTLAGIFTTVMAAGLTVILTGITKLVQTFPFLVPLIAAVVAVTWLWNAALAANPIGAVIIAIVALIGGIDLLVTHWSAVWGTIKSVAADVGTFLDNLFHNQIVQDILAIWSLGLVPLAEHWTAVWGAIQTTAEGFWNWLSQTFGTDIANFFTQTIPGWWDTCVAGARLFATNVQNAIMAVWTWLSTTFGTDVSQLLHRDHPGLVGRLRRRR